MTEDERDDLRDRIMPTGTPIWADEEELTSGRFGTNATLDWWFENLGHGGSHPGCCKSCGCCISCMLGSFYNSVVDTTLRELDRVGALRPPHPARPHPARPATA